MTDDNTLDAAIEAAGDAVVEAASARLKRRVDIVRPVKVTKAQRTYARALIAKLLEGMDGCDTRVLPSIYPAAVVWGYNAALTEIRRRAGLEVES